MNKSLKIFITTFLFWIAENLYFGFNIKALSPAESFCDSVVAFLILLIFILAVNDNQK